MKRLRNLIEWAGSIIGFLLLFGGPPEMATGLRIALLAVLGVALVVGVILLVIVVQSVRQPPYA